MAVAAAMNDVVEFKLLLDELVTWTPCILGNGVTRWGRVKQISSVSFLDMRLPVENNGSFAWILFCAQAISLSAIANVSGVRYPRFFSSAVSQIYWTSWAIWHVFIIHRYLLETTYRWAAQTLQRTGQLPCQKRHWAGSLQQPESTAYTHWLLLESVSTPNSMTLCKMG